MTDLTSPSATDTDGSVAFHLAILQRKIDEVAERAGVAAFRRLDLTSALAALPEAERGHVELVLGSVEAHADSPALQAAVGHVLTLAVNIWAKNPPPGEAAPVILDPGCRSGHDNRSKG